MSLKMCTIQQGLLSANSDSELQCVSTENAHQARSVHLRSVRTLHYVLDVSFMWISWCN